jgi:putative transposase
MPWKETSRMEERMRFIVALLAGRETMSDLCAQFGISRQTGYELRRRFALDGVEGLKDRSRAPHHCRHTTAAATAELLIDLRRAHPRWGPKKLLPTLRKRYPALELPAVSTAGEILKRAGLVTSGRRRRRQIPVVQPFAAVEQPNDAWCIDFKGWFRTGDGTRCDPLTVTDAFSRYLLVCEIMPERIEPVRTAVDGLFAECGLPSAIRSDNGAPFGGNGPAGLSRLSVHWLKLGIRLERIVPGKPQQNGQHERMHKDLKQDTTRPAAETISAQQRRFDEFRRQYNEERPHEALGQTPPAEHYHRSPRAMPNRIPEPWYDADHQVRRVRPDGAIKWAGQSIFISEALAGEPIGIAETASGHFIVRFAGVDLGLIDWQTQRFRAFGPPQPRRSGRRPQTNDQAGGAVCDGRSLVGATPLPPTGHRKHITA